MRLELREIVARFVAGLTYDSPPIMSASYEERLASLADLVSVARSGVVRDRGTRDLTLAPQPEAPARLAKQLAALTTSHAIIRGMDKVADADYAFAFGVARDSIPTVRLLVMDALAAATDYLKTSRVSEVIGYPTMTARRTLEDLAALGVVTIQKAEGQGQADLWRLSDSATERMSQALLPEANPDTEKESVTATSEGMIGRADAAGCSPLVHAALDMGAVLVEPDADDDDGAEREASP